MKKIPVLETIRDAYRFAFTHLGAIIGLIWLPMILITVIGFFVLQRYYEAFADALASGNYASMGPEALGFVCYLVAAMLLSTMMSVPVTQLAMGKRKHGALVHFAFGGVEWRLFRGIMSLVGLLLAPLLVAGVVISLLQADGGSLGMQQAMLAILAMELLFCVAGVYLGLRFGLLLPAVAVSETGPLLPRAWTLTQGNFWRLFAVAAATIAPVWIASLAVQAVLEGPDMSLPDLHSSTAMAAAQFHLMAMNMPLTSGIGFLIAPLLLGLVLGAAASVYRTLARGSVDEIA